MFDNPIKEDREKDIEEDDQEEDIVEEDADSEVDDKEDELDKVSAIKDDKDDSLSLKDDADSSTDDVEDLNSAEQDDTPDQSEKAKDADSVQDDLSVVDDAISDVDSEPPKNARKSVAHNIPKLPAATAEPENKKAANKNQKEQSTTPSSAPGPSNQMQPPAALQQEPEIDPTSYAARQAQEFQDQIRQGAVLQQGAIQEFNTAADEQDPLLGNENEDNAEPMYDEDGNLISPECNDDDELDALENEDSWFGWLPEGFTPPIIITILIASGFVVIGVLSGLIVACMACCGCFSGPAELTCEERFSNLSSGVDQIVNQANFIEGQGAKKIVVQSTDVKQEQERAKLLTVWLKDHKQHPIEFKDSKNTLEVVSERSYLLGGKATALKGYVLSDTGGNYTTATMGELLVGDKNHVELKFCAPMYAKIVLNLNAIRKEREELKKVDMKSIDSASEEDSRSAMQERLAKVEKILEEVRQEKTKVEQAAGKAPAAGPNNAGAAAGPNGGGAGPTGPGGELGDE